MGAPPVWNAPYQVGVMALGAWRGLSGRAAVMNSLPPPVFTRSNTCSTSGALLTMRIASSAIRSVCSSVARAFSTASS